MPSHAYLPCKNTVSRIDAQYLQVTTAEMREETSKERNTMFTNFQYYSS
jgi:hypothetical protein